MISEADWDLIVGLLEDAKSDDNYDDDTRADADDLLKRIESGEAKAPVRRDDKGLDAGELYRLLRDTAEAVHHMGVDGYRRLIGTGVAARPGRSFHDMNYPYGYAVTPNDKLNQIGTTWATFK